MKAEVYSIDGKSLGRFVELPESIFGIEPNDHVLYLAVKQFLANRRSGTHKTKEVSDVSGSTKKLVRQKGTGGARKGSGKSPLLKGGARIFGPRPRDYSFKLNKKVIDLARKSALSTKFKEEKLKVLEDFTFDTPKTKSYLSFLKAFGLENRKSLVVVPDYSENVLLASRNIKGANYTNVNSLHAYDILNANQVFLCEKALEALNN